MGADLTDDELAGLEITDSCGCSICRLGREVQRRRAADRSFLVRVMARTKHGPSGSGREGACDEDCVKCEAARRAEGK